MKSKFPFELSLSKPFGKLRVNGSYFTESESLRREVNLQRQPPVHLHLIGNQLGELG
jgi:hypothetical protein